jgi:hypothetical protein
MGQKSIARQVFEALDNNPYLQQAIRLGIANHSAIAKRLRVRGSRQAVKAAVMRYSGQMARPTYAENVEAVLRKSRLRLESSISAITVKELGPKIAELFGGHSKVYSIVNSHNAVTIIVEDSFLEEAHRTIGPWNTIKKRDGLCLLLITSPKEIESTPGVLVFLLEKLAQAGINVVEFYSCYTDTGLALSRDDATRAFSIIERCLR